MKPDSGKNLMLRVLECTKCRNDDRTRDLIPKGVYPVYSFGNPRKKEVAIVGLNPSKNEYGRYLSQDPNPEKRAESQFGYFQGDRSPHPYFQRLNGYFSKKAKRLLHCEKYIWERAVFLDLVKCATPKSESKEAQWSGLKRIPREAMIGNCEDYLMQQIWLYRPKLLISCGQDTTHWVERNRHRLPSNMRSTWLPQPRYQKIRKLREDKRRLEREIVEWKSK